MFFEKRQEGTNCREVAKTFPVCVNPTEEEENLEIAQRAVFFNGPHQPSSAKPSGRCDTVTGVKFSSSSVVLSCREHLLCNYGTVVLSAKNSEVAGTRELGLREFDTSFPPSHSFLPLPRTAKSPDGCRGLLSSRH